jgi:hypothetical protein
MEKTKQAIDMYYTIRTLIPDMFENIHPNLPQMQELMDIAYCTILCSMEKTKQAIDMYYTIRTLIPDMFEIFIPICTNAGTDGYRLLYYSAKVNRRYVQSVCI